MSIKIYNFSGQTLYVGLDVHKKSWTVTVRTLGLEVAHFSQTRRGKWFKHEMAERETRRRGNVR